MPRPCTIRLLLLAASLLALSQAASADVPGRIATQGVLRTDAGSPVSDGKYPMVIKIYDTGQGGEALWTEFHIAVAVAGGFFALDLGSVDAKNPPPMALFATKADLWIGLQVSDNPELPRTKLASVPFAAKALLADSATAAIKADTAAKADTAEALSKPITGDLIAPGSLSASAVGFTYAGSNTKGGPAIDLQCTGCVGLDELDPGVLVGTNVAVGGPLKGSSAAHVYAALSELFDLYAVLTGTLQVKPGQLGVGKAPADGCALDVAGATCEAGAPVLHSRVVPSQQDLEAITTVGLYAWRTDTNRPYVRHPLGWRELVMKPLCGDGVQEGGEACDDGKNNANAPDACRPTCVKPSCGDKVADTGEACDDGNGDNTDACLATCKLASCGDGHVYAGVEECDDGNGDYTDACVKDCKKSKCGDGYVLAGVEDCDLGPDNGKPNGTCTADCKNVNLTPTTRTASSSSRTRPTPETSIKTGVSARRCWARRPTSSATTAARMRSRSPAAPGRATAAPPTRRRTAPCTPRRPAATRATASRAATARALSCATSCARRTPPTATATA